MLRPVVFQHYFHVLGIPCFPLGKKVFFDCRHCKHLVVPREVTPALAPFAAIAKASAQTPISVFFGLAVFATLAAVAGLRDMTRSAMERQWLSAPAVGDYYVLDVSEAMPDLLDSAFSYVVGRVDKVTSKEVDVRFGSYSYALKSGAKKAIEHGDTDKKGYFGDDRIPLARSELLTWHEKNNLVAVIRE